MKRKRGEKGGGPHTAPPGEGEARARSLPVEDDDDIPKIGLAAKDAGADAVPHIGRGKTRLNIPVRQVFVIGMTLITLIVILVMRKSCADGVGKAFNNFAPPPPDAGVTYIQLPGPPVSPGARPTAPPAQPPSSQPGPPPRPVPSTPGR